MTPQERDSMLNKPISLRLPLGEALGHFRLTQITIERCLECLKVKNCEPCKTTLTQTYVLQRHLIVQLANNGITKEQAEALMNYEEPKSPTTVKNQLINQIKYN